MKKNSVAEKVPCVPDLHFHGMGGSVHLLVDARLTEPAEVTVQPTSCPPKSMHTSFKIA